MKKFSGTYKGLGKEVELILRLDIDGPSSLNMLSGELNQSVELKQFNYFNLRQHSFIGDDISRSDEGNRLLLTTPIRFYRLPELTGMIEVELQPTSAVARLKLTGYGYHNQPLVFALEKTSDFFRSVRLEIDLEQGTEYPGPYYPWQNPPENLPAGMPQNPITIQSAYQEAGLELIVQPGHTTIPPADAGADSAWNSAELHAAMMNYFSLVADQPTWNTYFMVCERYVNPGVSGIMFDSTDPLPRQGAAIFYHHYRGLPDGIRQRNFVRTAVHEIGHSLNLLHSFQKGVFSEFGFGDNPFMMPRSDALSFMNYPWRYPYGHNRPAGWDGTEDHWARFNFEFDPVELMHLRHHDRLEVMFGGEAFGIHGHSRVPALEPPEITQANQRSPLVLELRGKQVRAQEIRAFEIMEPIHLELKLACKEDKDVEIVNQLDPSQGGVAVYIQKPSGELAQYRPMMKTCSEASQLGVLKPGLPRYHDLHLTFGKDGFYFQEPGVYSIRVVYLGGEKLTTYSNVMTLRVGAPKTAEQELLAADFFDPIKGQLLATGPCDSAQFTSQIDFFREVVDKLPETNVGKALAGYLGMVDGIRFKDISHELVKENGMVLRKARLTTTKARTKEGLAYLDQALRAPQTPFVGLSNLVSRQLWLDQAQVLKASGDIPKAEEAIDKAKTFVSETIGGNGQLRKREVDYLEDEKKKLRKK